MLKRLSIIAALTCALAATGLAQNSNTSNTTRKRTSTTSTKTTNTSTATDEQSGTPQSEAKPARKTTQGKRTGNNEPTMQDVDRTFDALIAGITRADVEAVTGIYWNSPQLVLFNNNGSVTKGWQQMHTNRASSYPNLKDVKLDVRDKHVQMLGRDGAVVYFLWTQSQTVNGAPETATGRTTLVLRRIGTAWKIVHAHTSPDSPDQSRVLPSERTTPTPSTTPKVRP